MKDEVKQSEKLKAKIKKTGYRTEAGHGRACAPFGVHTPGALGRHRSWTLGLLF